MARPGQTDSCADHWLEEADQRPDRCPDHQPDQTDPGPKYGQDPKIIHFTLLNIKLNKFSKKHWKNRWFQNLVKFSYLAEKCNHQEISDGRHWPLMGCYFEKRSMRHKIYWLTQKWALKKQNSWPNCGCWPDQTDRTLGIGQIKQTEIRVWDRPKEPT